MSQPASMYNASMSQKGWTSSAYDGVSIKNVYTNPITKRVVLFSENAGPYDNLLSCKDIIYLVFYLLITCLDMKSIFFHKKM